MASIVYYAGGSWTDFPYDRERRFPVIEVTRADDELCTFTLSKTDASVANAVRRIIQAEVYSMAIESVNIEHNSTALFDEFIAHRMGLLPLTATGVGDLPGDSGYNEHKDCGCADGCHRCSVEFQLDVTNEEDKILNVTHFDLKATGRWQETIDFRVVCIEQDTQPDHPKRFVCTALDDGNAEFEDEYVQAAHSSAPFREDLGEFTVPVAEPDKWGYLGRRIVVALGEKLTTPLEYRGFPEKDKLGKRLILWKDEAGTDAWKEEFPNVLPIPSRNDDLDPETDFRENGILIVKLKKDQRIGMTCVARKGIPKYHAKFMPVVGTLYNFQQIINLDREQVDGLSLDEKVDFVQSCPRNVFDLDNDDKVQVARLRDCHYCDECIAKAREFGKRELVTVKMQQDMFHFRVEAVCPEGPRKPADVVRSAMRVLDYKMQLFLQDAYGENIQEVLPIDPLA